MSFITRGFTAQEASLLNLDFQGIQPTCIPRQAGWLYAIDESRNAILIPLEPEYLNGRDGYADPLYVLVHQRKNIIFRLGDKRLFAHARGNLPPRQIQLLEDIANEAYLALQMESEAPAIALINTRASK